MGYPTFRQTDFHLEGRFLDLFYKDGCVPKYLRLSTATGEHTVKLAKEIRYALPPHLMPGEWLQVTGCQKFDYKKGIIKLKAYEVIRGVPGLLQVTPEKAVELESYQPQEPGSATKADKKVSILVCQKSDCCKRGGRQISKALESALSDRQLTDTVTIKGTGCMKRCKAGPNIVMPDKTRYCNITPEAIPQLIDQHFQSQQNKSA